MEPSDRVFISDLPEGTDEASINSIFGAYGHIKSCKMVHESAAIVQFVSVEEAKWIVDNLHGNLAQGLSTPVNCKYANPPGGGKGSAAWQPGGNKGGHGGGGARWEPYGGNSWGGKGGGDMKGDKGGSCKGKGKCGVAVLKKGLLYAGVLPGGKWQNDENALFVSGLPPDTTNADLYDIFAPFGAIPSQGVYAMQQEDGTCKGIGFVNFLEQSACQSAMNTLNGTMMPDGSMLRVMPKGQPKSKAPP